ncbi:hypothetical protein V0288_18610 [Pannus brasiliensis CCIBt3594]|uniref:Antitoxin n=1 Tax=Pannus brasiliensis CCIBt3594 TaxID=1427578 RepID=A0AAW9QQG5_9CHRO
MSELHQKIDAGVKQAIARAIERHRQLGESIAISENGKVTIVPADRIPELFTENYRTEPL